MLIDFEIGDFPIPLISGEVAEELAIESGELILLNDINGIPLCIISVAVGNHPGKRILLPEHSLQSDHHDEALHIEKFVSAPKANEVTVTIIDENHAGILIEDFRKKISDIRYFVDGQTSIIKPDDRELQIQIHSGTHKVFCLDEKTRIQIIGENIPRIEEIGGQKELIDWYKDEYLFALRANEYLRRWHIPSPRGLLLSGKPGLGKTHFLKAMVADSGVYHISIFAPNIITPLAGDGDKVIMETFAKARKNSPAIISIDEIDALCLKRSDRNQNYENRVVTVLLQEMDGVLSRGDVFVIGATNRPEAIDEAFLRPGRLSKHITLTAPTLDERVTILKIHLKYTDYHISDQELLELATQMEGYTPAQIADVVYQAAISRLKKHLDFQQKVTIILSDLSEKIPFIS